MHEEPRREAATSAPANTPGRWKVEDAKTRFDELVRRARANGPQRVTVRGHDAVVVVSAETFDNLVSGERKLPFVSFMESLALSRLPEDELDMTRERDSGRDVDL